MVSHLKMPIFLCYIAQGFVCLFRTNFGLTKSICFFIDFISAKRASGALKTQSVRDVREQLDAAPGD